MLEAFGSNGSGQLGIGHTDDVSAPSVCVGATRSSPIKQIVAGGNHTLILYEDGNVCTAGLHAADQSASASSCTFQPLQVRRESEHSADEPAVEVVQVSATWSASVFLCEDGSVMTMGEGSSGELGHGDGVTVLQSPRTIANFPPSDSRIVHIASGMGHTIAVLSNGEVYGWGKGRRGQLGGTTKGNVWSPQKIEGTNLHAVTAVCGKDFTCVAGASSQGDLIVLGSDLNDKFRIRAGAPHAVPGWRSIAASWCSVFVLLENGQLLAWGRDDHGQLPPVALPPIKAIAAGSEHVMCLTHSGSVLTWGWGEHGNCGKPIDQNGDVKGRWNQIATDAAVISVFAGCATSFVLTSERKRRESEPP